MRGAAATAALQQAESCALPISDQTAAWASAPACLQPCGLYEGIEYPTKVRWANANESSEEPEPVVTPLQRLLSEPVLVTTPRAGAGTGCLRRCSPPECAPAPRSSFPATGVAVFSPDCSKVPDAAKAWTAKEVSPTWWQLSDGKGSCLTIDAKTLPLFTLYSCACIRGKEEGKGGREGGSRGTCTALRACPPRLTARCGGTPRR